LKDAGCTARVYTWFEEDEDTPHPELEQLVGKELASLARPKRNCIVAAFEDHSGYEGPTGTFVDGPINFFASTLDDLITTTVFPIDRTTTGRSTPCSGNCSSSHRRNPTWATGTASIRGSSNPGITNTKAPSRPP
jgi:hypothetical protein